ncbi:MAG: hypothetical protein ACTHMI_04610 [Mucilaginibacter sp.]
MRCNHFFLLTLASLLLFSCEPPTNQSNATTENKPAVSAISEQGYTVITTTKLTTAKATKQFKAKDRNNTQFALDRNSMQEKEENFKIKLSDSRVLVCDMNDRIMKDLSVIKKWVDKSGPSTVYDLKDKNDVEYSLDHYIDIEKKDFLAFRFSKSLETYTNE